MRVTVADYPRMRSWYVTIVNAGGSLLAIEQLGDMPVERVISSDLIASGESACVVALIVDGSADRVLRARLVRWARRVGWVVTLAPVHGAEYHQTSVTDCNSQLVQRYSRF